jgi:hypothetical protein
MMRKLGLNDLLHRLIFSVDHIAGLHSAMFSALGSYGVAACGLAPLDRVESKPQGAPGPGSSQESATRNNAGRFLGGKQDR